MRALVALQALVVTLAVAMSARSQDGAGSSPASSAGDLDSQIVAAMAEIERSGNTEVRLQAEVEGLSGRQDVAGRRLRHRARALFRLRRAGMLPLASGFDAMLGHMARVARLQRMVRRDASALSSLGRREDALRAEKASVATSLLAARSRLRALNERKQVLEEEQRMNAMFGGAFDAGAPDPYFQSGYGSLRVLDEAPDRRRSFILSRGRLGMPVGGAADVREGRREGGVGLEFLAASGTAVRAVYDGRVAFADTYGEYGLLLILDHGDSYFTVYGGLGRVGVRVGDPVARGAPIGTVGEGGPDAGLFFQVRRGTRTLDAPSWLGL